MRKQKLLTALLALAFISATAAHAQTTREAEHPVRAHGTLKKVEDKALIITLESTGDTQGDVSVPITDNTRILLDREPDHIEDLKPGMSITANEFNTSNGPFLSIRADSPSLHGTISAIDGNTLTITVAHDDKNGADTTAAEPVKIQTDDKTRVFFLPLIANHRLVQQGGVRKLEDLTPDLKVTVIPPKGTATKIIVEPAKIDGGL